MSRDENSSFAGPLIADVDGQLIVPVLQEDLEIGKRTLETGTVRLHRETDERTETVEMPLTRVQWHVEHVLMNEVVMEQPPVRYEGETTIYPVTEERLVVLREMVLVEEVRVTRNAETTTEVSSHVLKRERISDERVLPS